MALFAPLYKRVSALPEDDQEVVKPLVKQIEKQANALRANANDQNAQNTLVKRLKALMTMAPDIGEVAITTLANPMLGIKLVIDKIKRRANEELRAETK